MDLDVIGPNLYNGLVILRMDLYILVNPICLDNKICMVEMTFLDFLGFLLSYTLRESVVYVWSWRGLMPHIYIYICIYAYTFGK